MKKMSPACRTAGAVGMAVFAVAISVFIIGIVRYQKKQRIKRYCMDAMYNVGKMLLWVSGINHS